MLTWLATAALLLAPTFQEPAKPAPKNTLQRVVVLGASLAAGFGAERTFADALEASLRTPAKPPLGLGDVLFFTSPNAIGGKQVQGALDAEPSLVVALDFLFWFGYGALDAKGGPIDSEAQRLELLEHGLGLLEEFECPLVLGDFPDMSASVGKMLAPAQMPQKTTLPLLSRRVREWAAARPHTLVLPLSELVVRLGGPGEITIGRHTFPAGTKLLQDDQLHPTLEGMAATAQLVCDELVKAGLARREEFELELPAVMVKLRKLHAHPIGAGQR